MSLTNNPAFVTFLQSMDSSIGEYLGLNLVDRSKVAKNFAKMNQQGENQSGATFSGATFDELPPDNLNGNRLYQREIESQTLGEYLLSHTGNVIIPIMDQCYGAGKTSLAYKFRSVIETLPSTSKPRGMETLTNAVYLHCLFEESIKYSISNAVRSSSMDEVDYDSFIIDVILRKLNLSCKRNVVLPSRSIACLIDALNVATTKFIFHFDEVGIFEDLGRDVGGRLLYRLLHIAYSLKRHHHFSIITGRSMLLHVVGVGKNLFDNENPSFQSPCTCQLIQLPCLKESPIQRVFIEDNFDDYISKDDNLYYVWVITGGVPRAVSLWIVHLRTLPEPLPNAKDDSDMIDQLSMQSIITIPSSYRSIYQRLLELSWAEIEFNLSTAAVGGLPLTSLLARLGLYTTSTSTSRSRIVVPLFVMKAADWSPRSIRAISEYEDAGLRLECGFRRILFLRLALESTTTCWRDVGLDCLDSYGVPFQSIPATNTLPFPKISSNVTQATLEDVSNYMAKIKVGHKCDRSTFPPDFLNTICSLMEFGHYYQSLAMSDSADSFIRLAESILIAFQFKNLMEAIKLSQVLAEIEKCKVTGWTVYLVIVCSSGHNMGERSDATMRFVVGGVTAIVLSQKTVQMFFGAVGLHEIISQGTLVEAFHKMRLNDYE